MSVGVVDGACLLDLDYSEDARAEVDMNVVMTGSGRFIEVQGTAEGLPFSRVNSNEMLRLAEQGIAELVHRPGGDPGGAAAAEVTGAEPVNRPEMNGSSRDDGALTFVLATANPDKAAEIVAIIRQMAGDPIVPLDRPRVGSRGRRDR